MVDVRLRPEDLAEHHETTELVIDGKGILSPARARRLVKLPNLRRIVIRADCKVTRPALNVIATHPGVEALENWTLKDGGQLAPFTNAAGLKSFDCNFCLTSNDIIAIVKAPGLERLSAQSAAFDHRAARALAAVPRLTYLDLEGAYNVTDDSISILARSTSLEELLLCGAKLSDKGLSALAGMKQLKKLDLWATGVLATDLKFLHELPNLEWVSIGCGWGGPGYKTDVALDILSQHPTLRAVWLDDVPLTKAQMARLDDRFDEVYATIEGDNEWHNGPAPWPLMNKRVDRPADA